MSKGHHIVVGMWGTTNLLLSLVNVRTGLVVSEKSGPGVSRLNGRSVEDILFGLIEPWISDFGVTDIQLSGMVGSDLGWANVPYLKCPIDINAIAFNQFTFEARGLSVSIVPGLSCENPLGHPDLMRGEETELLAWIVEATDTQLQESVVCIPGTHAKWVHVKNGHIQTFLTSVVGEVYQVISANEVLAKPHYQTPVQSSQAFMRAVKDVASKPENLLNLLFTTRANTVVGKFTQTDATDYLSGLLIGADLNSAIECFGLDVMKRGSVPLIGAQYLTERYQQGLAHWGIEAQRITAADIGVKGLLAVHSAALVGEGL